MNVAICIWLKVIVCFIMVDVGYGNSLSYWLPRQQNELQIRQGGVGCLKSTRSLDVAPACREVAELRRMMTFTKIQLAF